MRNFLLVTTLLFGIFLTTSVFAQDEVPTTPTNQLYIPIINASPQDVVDDTGVWQTFMPNPETLTLDPVDELNAASSCSSSYPGLGNIRWCNLDPKKDGYSVLPEHWPTTYPFLVWPTGTGSTQAIDGIYRKSWNICTALKIPDNCTAILNPNETLSSHCVGRDILGKVRWVNTCSVNGDEEPWPNSARDKVAPPSGYVACADENQAQGCIFKDMMKDIAYGANGRFSYRYGIIGRIDCNNNTFGDPIAGVVKACYITNSPPNANRGPNGYTRCASENQRCSFSGTKTVAYGANGQFNYKSGITGGINCNNSTFGDPIPGVVKSCYSITISNSGPSGYTRCAGENQHCDFSGTKTVAYGSNGQFNYRLKITGVDIDHGIRGGVECNNSEFGDPITGVVKACYFK